MEAAVAGHLVWCCTDCGAIYRTDFPRCPSDGAEVIAASRDPLVGTTVDNYAIEDLIGEGAMGRVYRAHHRHLHDRRYAVKVLIGDLAVTAASRIRFAKEAESASKLSHPNVVGVYDVGRSSKGLLYIAMELVDGEPASNLVDRGPVEVARVLEIARGVCAGLAHAHAAGIVHRDLKPDNILLVDGIVPRIADFGLAISTEPSSTRLTTTGMTMGTPAYIAPEQASGKPVDHRADLYSLGVSMFELLTGKLPFEAGDPVEMVTLKVMGSAPSMEQRAPEVRVPAAVSRLVMKLLARYPDERYQSADDVIVAIDRLRNASGIADRCATPRRSRTRMFAAIAGALAIAGGATAWSLTSHDPEPVAAEIATSPAVVARLESPTPSPVIESPMIESPMAETPWREPAVASTFRAHRRHSMKPAPIPPPEPPPPAPAVVVETPPAAPVPVEVHTYTAHVAGIDVSGSLRSSVVGNALDRIAPAIAACHSHTAQTIILRFTIGESRRPESLSASQRSADASCVTAAIAGVHTTDAPDVGDASVSVKVLFR